MAIQVLEGKAACVISIRVPATCLGMQEERKDVSRDLGLSKREAVVIMKPGAKCQIRTRQNQSKSQSMSQCLFIHLQS